MSCVRGVFGFLGVGCQVLMRSKTEEVVSEMPRELTSRGLPPDGST